MAILSARATLLSTRIRELWDWHLIVSCACRSFPRPVSPEPIAVECGTRPLLVTVLGRLRCERCGHAPVRIEAKQGDPFAARVQAGGVVGEQGQRGAKPRIRMRAGSRARVLWSAAASIVMLCGITVLLFALAQPSPPQFRYLSPDGRYAAVVTSDASFGQVEHLQVLIDPGKPGARLIFEAVGDVPLHFLGWRDGATAELEEPPHDGNASRRLLLRCAIEVCRLERVPKP